ncbi:hypothetical protein LTR91_012699 [Friedmanniomyces endolithicus]|uniref:Ubiquitin-like domain-containing protein n=1 Tax=Friedmanniomyces endolithicus TaxID=329885 RepID=A0AAN6KF20_9PEZI|nr:hypothetical protein LTR57_012112 [Friedmanniomyces endolithicus]KAK0979101.1 hypothetical protein LTR91_012699 [Friedmanniomyces endolithicus]KAK0991895.1 hypothetical protein LTS01_007984 [Friedmanniomyces endolithicus]KAK1047365.1 hypothetical protein LTS16_005135 [Friedmanniomyces endolithicus]
MSLFNRPAWAITQDAGDEASSENIFSHSKRSFAESMAEERRTRKAREQKLQREQERRERRSSAKQEVEVQDVKAKGKPSPSKRRRITLEEGDDLLGSIGLSPGLAKRTHGGGSKDLDASPVRRSPRINKIAGKGDSRFAVEGKPTKPLVADVQDDSDHEDEVQFSHARPVEPVEPVEQDSDDEFAELARAARARAKLREESMKKSQTPGVKSPTPGQQVASLSRARSPTPPPPDPHVSLLITSRIEGTKPLMVIRKLSQRLQEIRHVWCERQGFSKEFAEGVYLIHRMRRVFDVTTCRSLGLNVDAGGNVTMKGAEWAEGVEKVALEAVTDEIYAQIKAERDREERIRQGLDEAEEEEAQAGASEAVAQPVEPIVRILLISKERKEPFKLKVKPRTTVAKIMAACKPQFDLAEGQSMYLDFDGERLHPDQSVQDTEITDMDRIDVHVY